MFHSGIFDVVSPSKCYCHIGLMFLLLTVTKSLKSVVSSTSDIV